MALIKNLSSKKLKRIQGQLEVFEFYGLSEEDIKSLPTLIKENKELKIEIEELREDITKLAKTINTINDPNTKFKREIGSIVKDCFTLPEGD